MSCTKQKGYLEAGVKWAYSNKPVHQTSFVWKFVFCWQIESISRQQRPWSDCANAQSDLSLCCLYACLKTYIYLAQPMCPKYICWSPTYTGKMENNPLTNITKLWTGYISYWRLVFISKWIVSQLFLSNTCTPQTPPDKALFWPKSIEIFLNSAWKCMLWVLIRSASLRTF